MSDHILFKALQRLNQPEKYDKYWAYLSGEWLSSKEDLSIASKDEQVWSELKLPVRLKIEIKNILEESLDTESYDATLPGSGADSKTHSEEEISKAWTLYYSDEHQAYYYYNSITGESQWAASEEYDNNYDNQGDYQGEQSPSRVFSKPKVQKGNSQTFVKGQGSNDEEDEDGRYRKDEYNKKIIKKSTSKSKASSKRRSDDSYESDQSDSDYSDEDSYYSSSSSRSDSRSDESNDSKYYIISEETSSKRPGKVKVERYTLPKEKNSGGSANQNNMNGKRDVGFTNKFKEHLHLDDDHNYDDMAVPVRSTRDQSMPSAPTDYEQTLQQYRQNTKLMSGNDINSQTPVLAKKNSAMNRRDAYMGQDNLRSVDEKLTPKSSPAFAAFPTPILDHGEVYDAPNTDDVVDGMNDMLLRELAMGYSNGLLPKAPTSPPPPSKNHSGESRQNVIHRYPVRPKADSRIEDMEQSNKQRGFKDMLSEAVGVGKKPPIPGNLPNHIDALHGQPFSPADAIRTEKQRKEEKEVKDIQSLVDLGFNERAVRFALQMSDWNFDEAYAMLAESQTATDYGSTNPEDPSNIYDCDPSSEPIMMDTVDAVLVENHLEHVPTATDPIAVADPTDEVPVTLTDPPKKKKSGIKKLLKMFK